MQVVTWNVNSLRARMAHLLRFLDEVSPDVVCLQELKLTDDLFPAKVLREAGYPHLVWWGQKNYNGVAMLSKHPIDAPQKGIDDGGDRSQSRLIAGTVNGIRIIGVYAPNGTRLGSEPFAFKLSWYDRLFEMIASRHRPSDPIILCGDLNIAPDDPDVWDPFRCDGILLCHPLERERFQRFLDWGFVDPFRERHPFANTFSWWDYQQMGFQRNHGLRIDHTLLTAPVDARCSEVTIHANVRGWTSPSDHAPVSVTLS